MFYLPYSVSLYPSYMKHNSVTTNRHTARRQVALRRLGQIGPFLEGSLCSFKRPGCSAPGWHLTFKQKAKTRTVYVPMDLVPEVKEWNRTYRHSRNSSGRSPGTPWPLFTATSQTSGPQAEAGH
jgi:hypothetical protein